MAKRRQKNASSVEFDFFLRADLSRFAGQYIAVVGQKVVASGSNAQEVWKKAKRRFPSAIPTIGKLPRAETLVCPDGKIETLQLLRPQKLVGFVAQNKVGKAALCPTELFPFYSRVSHPL